MVELHGTLLRCWRSLCLLAEGCRLRENTARGQGDGLLVAQGVTLSGLTGSSRRPGRTPQRPFSQTEPPVPPSAPLLVSFAGHSCSPSPCSSPPSRRFTACTHAPVPIVRTSAPCTTLAWMTKAEVLVDKPLVDDQLHDFGLVRESCRQAGFVFFVLLILPFPLSASSLRCVCVAHSLSLLAQVVQSMEKHTLGTRFCHIMFLFGL